jgi:hypothetical protein
VQERDVTKVEDSNELYIRLKALFLRLKAEVEKQLGHEVYWRNLKSGTGWKLQAREGEGRGVCNFGYVETRLKKDKKFPHCPLPHLRVVVKKDWADGAFVTPENVKENDFFGEPGAYWCTPEGDNEKLKRVARYLAEIYRLKCG